MKYNYLIKLADKFYDASQGIIKISTIKKMPNGKYRVLSEDGKNLGTFKSKELAKKRLKQVEYFKHFDNSNIEDSKSVINLMKVEEFSYTAIMRQLRKNADKDQVICFLKMYKLQFDNAIKKKLQSPEKVALQNAMVKFNKIHKIKIDKDIVKNASVSELGTPEQIGKYLSDIVRFTITRVPYEKRESSIKKIKEKFYNMPASELEVKNLPDSAAIGQSITFVKHVLFGHDATYIRDVLNAIANNL